MHINKDNSQVCIVHSDYINNYLDKGYDRKNLSLWEELIPNTLTQRKRYFRVTYKNMKKFNIIGFKIDDEFEDICGLIRSSKLTEEFNYFKKYYDKLKKINLSIQLSCDLKIARSLNQLYKENVYVILLFLKKVYFSFIEFRYINNKKYYRKKQLRGQDMSEKQIKREDYW